jgi:hypothetical protein
MVFLVDQNVESQKTTFDVVIILNAIGKIRTSKTTMNIIYNKHKMFLTSKNQRPSFFGTP